MIVHYEIIDKPGDPKAKKSLIIFPNIYHSHQEMSFQPLNSTHLRTLRVGYSQPDLHIQVPHSTHLHVLTISSTFPTEHGRVNGDFYWSESRKPNFTPVIRPCWTKTSSTPIITPSAIHHSQLPVSPSGWDTLCIVFHRTCFSLLNPKLIIIVFIAYLTNPQRENYETLFLYKFTISYDFVYPPKNNNNNNNKYSYEALSNLQQEKSSSQKISTSDEQMKVSFGSPLFVHVYPPVKYSG